MQYNFCEKKNGMCTIHSYADPHWMGKEIDMDTLKVGGFYLKYIVRGDRQGPKIEEDNDCNNRQRKFTLHWTSPGSEDSR